MVDFFGPTENKISVSTFRIILTTAFLSDIFYHRLLLVGGPLQVQSCLISDPFTNEWVSSKLAILQTDLYQLNMHCFQLKIMFFAENFGGFIWLNYDV